MGAGETFILRGMQITKITRLNGKNKEVDAFAGVFVSDPEHARLDIMAYLRRYRGAERVEIVMELSEMHPGGGWEHQNEVEGW